MAALPAAAVLHSSYNPDGPSSARGSPTGVRKPEKARRLAHFCRLPHHIFAPFIR